MEDGDHVGPQGPEDGRCNLTVGPVGTVHDHLQPIELHISAVHDMFHIQHAHIRFLDHLSQVGSSHRLGIIHRLVHDGFDFILHRIRQFIAGPGKKLDPVVLKGIVGSGNHHPCIGFQFFCEIGDRRCGYHPQEMGVPSRAADPSRQGAFQHGTGKTGIPSDQDLGCLHLPSEILSRSTAQPVCQFRIEYRTIGDAADAVRSKHSSHQSPPACIGFCCLFFFFYFTACHFHQHFTGGNVMVSQQH